VKQAIRVAVTADSHGYSTKASDAFSKALSMAKSAGEAMSVAQSADTHGFSTTASKAYAKAAKLP
jgi:hypothetical protein